ncbi:MAG: amidophosphoribosyltransferase [Thermoplasmata archaeon]|jgi:amidophosphoribosyltransferase|nr:MAG: amidophosphoribosyltransferase [Thermoplasmata archaeon]RLF63934.1 MAG: amidophosphoribosyltransferase [Thermoplasmata archaeon]
MREKCGIAAAAAKVDVAPYLYFSLNALQHRGQEAAGIGVYDDSEQIKCYKGLGLVNEAFKDIDINGIKGKRGIGHTYYSVKISSPYNAQPTLVHTSAGDIALAHNGIITNSGELKERLLKEGHNFSMGSEEESMAFLLSDYLKTKNFEKAIKSMMRNIQGSYSLAIMFNNRVFGLRDPLGIKPLCLGKMDNGYVIASETVALDVLGAELIRDVKPGELIEITEDEYISYPLMEEKNKAHCFFEYVYFARADSIIDGKDVYMTRKKIGERLAVEHPVDADLVVPVPDSGRAHAYGYSEKSGIPIAEGLMKNRYVGRTFIMPTQDLRQKYILLKTNPIRSIVDGKRIVLVDDSIVRGTTMRQMVDLLRSRGAKEVHVRIGSPPIIAPCYFGIDMTTREQLIAHGSDVEEIREKIHADSLGYISIDGMVEAIGMERDDLCLGCVTGEYPIKLEGERERFQENLEKWE